MPNHSSRRHPQRRASRACEYCRKKRLKCTPEQRPCLNCQLYREECVYTERKKRTTGPSRLPKDSATVARKPRRRAPDAMATEGVPVQTSPAAEASLITDFLFSEQHGPNPDQAPATLVSPDPTGTLSSSNGIGQSPHWNAGFLGAMNQPQQQHLLDAPADAEMHPDYSSLVHDWELQVPMNYWDLDQQVHLEPSGAKSNIFGLQTAPPSPEDPRVSGIFSFSSDRSETADKSAIPGGLFIAKDARVNSFLGLHSAGSTLAVCLKNCSANSQSLGQLDHIQFLFDAGPHINECSVPEERRHLLGELPGKEFAEFGVQGTLDELGLLENWPSLYSAEAGQLDAVTYSAFALVVAIGALSDHTGRGVTDLHESVLKLYWQSWSLMDEVCGAPFLPSVQVLVLHIILQIQLGKEHFAWILCGTASRMAQSLGLHRRSPTRFNLSDEDMGLRSHLWWVIFGLHAFLSAVECRPPSLPQSMSDHDPLPLSIGDLPVDASMGALADIYHWSLKLAHIRHQYCAVVNRCDSVQSRLDALAVLDSRLVQWREEVPLDIRPGQQIIVPKTLCSFIALLHLDFFLTLCSIHWASLLSTPNPVIRPSHQSLRIRSSDHICVSAARSFIDMLNGLSTVYDGSRLFPITFHCYSCIIILSILYRNLAVHPTRITAKGDLEYFRAGKLHLERHSHPSKLSPTLRGLFENMLQAAEELLASTTA
ncbi:hypothetical protein BJY00DRAFT_310659 [Aspergillus carlsbadensis]|nr:hypothetical protein BJY00DRAFT_310659 [Aspergillus carlsbadensis]